MTNLTQVTFASVETAIAEMVEAAKVLGYWPSASRAVTLGQELLGLYADADAQAHDLNVARKRAHDKPSGYNKWMVKQREFALDLAQDAADRAEMLAKAEGYEFID